MKSILDELMDLGYNEETAQEFIAICTCDKMDYVKRRKRHKKYLFGKVKEIINGIIRVPVECYTRVVGYFRPVNQFNPGKQEEFRERVNYKIPDKI